MYGEAPSQCHKPLGGGGYLGQHRLADHPCADNGKGHVYGGECRSGDTMYVHVCWSVHSMPVMWCTLRETSMPNSSSAHKTTYCVYKHYLRKTDCLAGRNLSLFGSMLAPCFQTKVWTEQEKASSQISYTYVWVRHRHWNSCLRNWLSVARVKMVHCPCWNKTNAPVYYDTGQNNILDENVPVLRGHP